MGALSTAVLGAHRPGALSFRVSETKKRDDALRGIRTVGNHDLKNQEVFLLGCLATQQY